MTPKSRSAPMLMTLAVAIGSLALGACSSSSTKGQATTSEAPAKSDSVATQAQGIADKLTQRPTQLTVTDPITKPVPTGKKIVWLQCSIPDCAILGPPLKTASEYFGWSVDTINAGITPESVKAAWDLAVRAKPDAVVATGFPRSIFETELKQLAAAGTKVVDGYVTDPPADGITVTFAGRSSSRAIGDAMATWVLSKKGKASNVLLVHSSSFPTLGDVKDGFEGRYKALCSACKETVLDEPATAIGKDLPQNVAAKLRSDSSINYVVAEEGNMLLGLPEALKAAGINVPVIGQYPSETSIQYLKDGSIVKAIVMTQQVDSMFQATDALARAFAGQDFQADQPASPTWIVTPQTASQLESPYYLTPDYVSKYEAVWKGGKS